MKAYAEDLAFIHHVGYSWFARNAAPGILRELRSTSTGLIVDLGCGSGIWARILTDAGYRVLGVDISPRMIALARKTAPKARFQVASLLDFDIPPCGAVTAIGECVNYAFDAKNSITALSRFFTRVYRALSPGGVFLFDTAEPGRLGGATHVKSFAEGDGWTVLVDATEDANRLVRRITTFRKIGRSYRRSEETHTLNLYKASDLAGPLRKPGFRVQVRRGYGDYAPQGHRVLIARKPAL